MKKSNERKSAAGSGAFRISAENFDENYYLQKNPDVATAILVGEFTTAYDHYMNHGWREKRPYRVHGETPLNRVILTGASPSAAETSVAAPACFIEAVVVSKRGGIFLVGWADDRAHKLERLEIVTDSWRVTLDEHAIARVRRADVEQALGAAAGHAFGFWSLVFADQHLREVESATMRLHFRGGAERAETVKIRLVPDAELQETGLGYLARSAYFGNHFVETVMRLEPFIGTEMVRLNQAISKDFVASPYVERFGPQRRYKGSIVVCLYGKAEYLPMQNCLFSGRPGIEDYEFIYVSNSPEIAEQMLRDARTASRTYGIDQTLVILPGNAGFGAANNCAAAFSQSDRLLIVNPDVFPLDAGWAARHTDIVENGREDETRFFGAPLYYDDGSLMHAGMYFELDKGVTIETGAVVEKVSVRVEHYAKGAPPNTGRFLEPRPVPAITGAFMSVDRAWYEQLGGFTEDYVFGHYEDADLCLKSLARGTPPWLQPLRMWHLEGKGSKRQPVHDGGSLVNRWLFSRTWADAIQDVLEGPAPQHEAFHVREPRTIARRIFKVPALERAAAPEAAPARPQPMNPAQKQPRRAASGRRPSRPRNNGE